jgi:hypothetical protein
MPVRLTFNTLLANASIAPIYLRLLQHHADHRVSDTAWHQLLRTRLVAILGSVSIRLSPSASLNLISEPIRDCAGPREQCNLDQEGERTESFVERLEQAFYWS